MMAVRRWLARKLYPQAFEAAERHDFTLRLLDDLWQWCAVEFPDVGSAALWVKRSVRQRFMDRETYLMLLAEKRWDQTHVDSINEFREALRNRKAAAFHITGAPGRPGARSDQSEA